MKCHHHHDALVARISLILSRHSSLSFIALGRISGQHPVSSHSCWMYVRAGRPAFARPCVGVHKSTSLMSSSLLLQQCPTCRISSNMKYLSVLIRAWIFLQQKWATRKKRLSKITLVSTQSEWECIFAGRPTMWCPCVEVCRRTSLIRSFFGNENQYRIWQHIRTPQ